MFIPGWLLFIGAVVALFAFKRLRTAARTALGWTILIGGSLLLLGSLGFGIYFWVTHQFGLALLFGSPIIGLGIWGSIVSAKSLRDEKGRLKVDTLRARLKEHERKIAAAEGPAGIVEARLAFARELELGQTLCFLYKHIANYPTWYAQGDDGEAPWSSSVIAKDVIGVVAMRDMEEFGFTVAEDAEEDDCLTYMFSASGKGYAFCAFAESVPEVTLEATPGWTLQAVKVYVIDLPETVVLEALMIYETIPTHFRYRHETVEAFRPGDWLVELMSVADRVAPEYDARLKTAEQNQAQEQAKRFA